MTSEIGLDKVRGVVRRRKIVMITIAVAVFGCGLVLLWQMPPSYHAQAVIRVLEAQPAKEYVAPTVIEQLGERLKSLRLGVMARPLVAEAANDLDLWRAFPSASHDEVVEELRERMDVKLEGEDTFLLTYSDSNPERARALVNRVAELFMKRQVERRQQIASATVDALNTEVVSLRPQLDLAAKAVRDFKLAHYGALPEQQEGNLRTLDETTMEVNIQSTNLDAELDHRRQLLSTAMSTLRHHEETLAAQLYEARTKYTDDNPEVQKILAEYETVKAQRKSDEQELSRQLRENNPDLNSLDSEIARTRAILAGLRDRQIEVRRRVDATAKNGQDLAGLTLAYEALRDKHASTNGRLRDAELALQLERDLANMRFDLVEGAALPRHAATPERPVLAVGVLFLALALGLGVGFFLDAQDQTVRGPGDLDTIRSTPPLMAVVPKVSSTRSPKPNAEA